MSKFYLAAKYDKRREVLPIAALLTFAGYEVVSKWLNGSHDGNTPEDSDKYSQLDLEHIDACTHFVLFNLPIGNAQQSSGRHVELGYALAKQKTVIIVGPGSCIFYERADRVFATVEDFLACWTPDSKL